jgi:hypothetical protein
MSAASIACLVAVLAAGAEAAKHAGFQEIPSPDASRMMSSPLIAEINGRGNFKTRGIIR